ncbi:hypothetical protein WJX72_010889 [[Myrmecia] bisecta]|uniref:Uncharacterized protein n=1 Tax=[Myrmecia] bisecta TaxID=41462 RepID=A0AAW1R9T6_9CHLO
MGMSLHTGRPKASHIQLPLQWFDHILRHVGPLLPFPVFVVRWMVSNIGPPDPLHLGRGNWPDVLAVYICMTVLRTVIYLLHRAGFFAFLTAAGAVSALPVHLMSDHVFLGSCLVSAFVSEGFLLALDIRRASQARPKRVIQRKLLLVNLMVCTALFYLTCADMFYTCQYFHVPLENWWAAFSGFVFFQVPMGYWLLTGRYSQLRMASWVSTP